MDQFGDGRWERHRRPAVRMLASRWWRGGLAVTAGALPALAFPAPSLWWFAYVALVPWMLLARSAPTARRAALDGWLGGLGFMVAVHHWLLPSLHVFTVVIAALLGLLWAPWGWLVRRFLGGVPAAGRAAAALVVLPSGWLMVELVRSWEGLGGPWGLLGSSQWQVTPALRLASVGGVWLVSAFVVALNTGVALLAVAAVATAARTSVSRAPGVRRSTASGAPGALAPRTVPAVPVVPAVAGILAVATATTAAWAWAPRPEPAGHVRVAVVQPGVIEDGIASADERLAREEALTRTLVGRDLDLVVWGESSVGYDLADRPDVARRITALSREVGADIMVNVDARRSDRPGIFKSSVLVGPDGPTGDRYDKMRLVPFGEYIPARSLLGWATSVGKAAGEDRRRGDRQVVMDTGRGERTGHAGGRAPDSQSGTDPDSQSGTDRGPDSRPGTDRGPGSRSGTGRAADRGLRLGPLVCFESAFPDMSRRLTRDGAQLLLAQSATSSFQSSWAPDQHASLAAVRAAETGRPMVHATLTGVSAVHAPDGSRVGSPLGTSASAAAVYDVPLAKGETAYVRWGDWPVHAALVVLIALAALGAARRIHTRVRSFSRPAPERHGPRARTVHESPVRPGR
ncbi:apolipoprotein N-acyltransferase [Streptomyces sp. NPDC029674]|uniref:apolipoprotein N-acyltransferase n=1 Tax=Streptomyces sp. NPDC029674 TaxID=3365297 RepID=UPI003850A98E